MNFFENLEKLLEQQFYIYVMWVIGLLHLDVACIIVNIKKQSHTHKNFRTFTIRLDKYKSCDFGLIDSLTVYSFYDSVSGMVFVSD